MSEKKKLPRVKKRISISGVMAYKPAEFNFSFVSAPEKGRQQASGTPGCREHLCKSVFFANGVGEAATNNSFHVLGKDAPIDMTRLRLLVMTSSPQEEFKPKLFAAKAALNLFEAAAGWKKSTISTVIHEDENYPNCWLITGPGEWMSQPQLLSAGTLILRFCTKAGPFNTSNIKALVEDWKKYVENAKRNDWASCCSDTSANMRTLYDKLLPLVKNHKKIFGGIGLKEAWSADPNTSYSVRCGVRSFATGACDYNVHAARAAKRFLDILGK
jgi:hypothetical protein